MTDRVFDDLYKALHAFEGVSVLVLGDVMLDRFVYGSVHRISPESPVPVLKIHEERHMLGGAGNALANLAGLGVKAHFVSVIGDDRPGEDIKAMVDSLGYETQSLIVDEARPTTIKTRFLARHQQLLRTDSECSALIADVVKARIMAQVSRVISDVQAVILSDYNKGLLRADLIEEVIDLARSQNIPVIVDPKGADFSKYRGATMVTPNKKELSEALQDAPVGTDAEVVSAGRAVLENIGIQAVMATRSSEGLSIISDTQDPVHIRTTEKIEVFDVSGAGDTVIAVSAAALAAGASYDVIGTLANMAGSIVVTKTGTAPIRRQDLLDRLSGQKTTSHFGPESWDQAREHVLRWRARGLKVGFTNGCFDILHYGHVSYLNDARAHCDRLIVGLNTDQSVKVLKGQDRPVHDEISRAAVLSALSSVDMVVLFGGVSDADDHTACGLLQALQPDVYFKGGDYKVSDIPEAPTVQKYGGTVQVMPVYDGHSTTGSIGRIKQA